MNIDIWITDNITVRVFGGVVFVCNCVNDYCIMLSSNPALVRWLENNHESWNRAFPDSRRIFYNDNYHRQLETKVKQLEDTF